MTAGTVAFAPQLFIPHGVTDISFYTQAFGAVELYRFTNDDGSIHVAELSIAGAIFHLHEESTRTNSYSPATNNSGSVTIGLFVPDVDAIMNSARAAGGEVIVPAQDYDYGYRQGEIRDPFGHLWMIEKRI
ncbi:VOC family protein [Ferruginibacter sp.]